MECDVSEFKQTEEPNKFGLFEYPVQGNIRSFLRLESLFIQFQRNCRSKSQDNHFHALKLFFEILEILERGDTRSELIKELSRLLNYFQTLEANPDVDSSKLLTFLKQIKQLHHWTHNYEGRFGESIRKHHFIGSVKHRTSIPGGSCRFDCPELYLFLDKSPEARQRELVRWNSDIKGVETSVQVILRLIRDNGRWSSEQAPMGSFMIETAEQPVKLLRVKKLSLENAFPEFSCGKHRSSIHFMHIDQQYKKKPANSEVEFELACCY
jgi:cell division protein ZapD